MRKKFKDRLLALADFVEGSRLKFDMEVLMVQPACGSAGCIGGHAAYSVPRLRVLYTHAGAAGRFSWAASKFNAYYGTRHTQQEELCYPSGDKLLPYPRLTKTMAASAIRSLANTGQVMWPVEAFRRKR